MGTSFEEIEISALTYIKNDTSLDWDLKFRLPVFYRRMWNYMEAALPLFNRPPAMLYRLKDYTAPNYSDVIVSADTIGLDGSIDTGITGFELCSAGIIGTDAVGDPVYTPLKVESYDSETGVVVVSGEYDETDTIDIDFYSPGSLEASLNDTEKGILAFCVYVVWEHRFDNNALERASKVRDANFTTISEASQTQAGTARQLQVDAQLFDKLRQYEQAAAYLDTVMGKPLF